MSKSSRLRAEAQFTKPKTSDSEALLNRRQAERARSEKVDRLRALRLAKEEADRDAALQAKAEKARRPHRRSARSAAAIDVAPAVAVDPS